MAAGSRFWRRLRNRWVAVWGLVRSLARSRRSLRLVAVVGLLVVLALVTKAVFAALSTSVYTIF